MGRYIKILIPETVYREYHMDVKFIEENMKKHYAEDFCEDDLNDDNLLDWFYNNTDEDDVKDNMTFIKEVKSNVNFYDAFNEAEKQLIKD